jgi:diadenosine tetraphosphatase ApaH/serine/threonine PP2A family protein phosphatase
VLKVDGTHERNWGRVVHGKSAYRDDLSSLNRLRDHDPAVDYGTDHSLFPPHELGEERVALDSPV